MDVLRKAVPEGIVLLENDGTLPLIKGEKIALFGRASFEYVKSGMGSGGRVTTSYQTDIRTELKKIVEIDKTVDDYYLDFVKNNPLERRDDIWNFIPIPNHPVLDEELVKNASLRNGKAIFILSRLSGESVDFLKEKGQAFLLDEEYNAIKLISKYFSKFCVLINSGNIIDMNWVKELNIKSVAYVWQGGQDGGTGTVDALLGINPPSGKLSDTIIIDPTKDPAYYHFGDTKKNIHVEDIFVGYRYYETFDKENVLYPFGYGLTYTNFEITPIGFKKVENGVLFSVKIKNIGNYKGKEVVQVYASCPQGKLGKPARVLIGYEKTEELQINQEQTLDIACDFYSFSSYDDSGITGYPFSYVLEGGEYCFYIGNSVRNAKFAYSMLIEETTLLCKCSQNLAPQEDFEKITTVNGVDFTYEKAQKSQLSPNKKRDANIPKALEITGDKGIKLIDVKNGKHSLDEFVSQLSVKDLKELMSAEGFGSYKSPMPGTTGSYGGLTKELSNFGIPVVTMCDGPSGVRLECGATANLVPSGTLLACSFNRKINEEVYKVVAKDMVKYQVDVLLSPGMNIHRSLLCGRNFEYFSEDPFLAGTIATAQCKSLYEEGVFATVKHFAVNSQETERNSENEVLSERALREIFLKAFEIPIRSGYVKQIMTSYNKINGTFANSSYDLLTEILRNEWNYDGMVMTDWWPSTDDDEKFGYSNNDGGITGTRGFASLVRSQNDMHSVVYDTVNTKTNIYESIENGSLALGELQRNAKNILKFCMQTRAMDNITSLKTFECKNAFEEVEFLNNTADATIKERGVIMCELEYISNADILEQITVGVNVNNLDGRTTNIIVQGTNGKVGKIKFAFYTEKDENHIVVLPQITALKIRFYKD